MLFKCVEKQSWRGKVSEYRMYESKEEAAFKTIVSCTKTTKLGKLGRL
jgi:hypothetical protein